MSFAHDIRQNVNNNTAPNGYICTFFIDGKPYILSPEVLQILLSHINHEDLLTCHFVCKNWKAQIQKHVWRMKAELTVHENFSHDHNVPWQVYHWICKMNRNPFEKNLLKNHSGENGLEDWTTNRPQNWTVENPPVGIQRLPVEEDPTLEGKQFCFATHFGTKNQTINLVDAGFHSYVLDTFKPLIEVSEWCCGQEGSYKKHYLLVTDTVAIIDLFIRTISTEEENKWIHVIHECDNYQPGLRRITFVHSARSISSEINCKLAGACVKIKFPYVTANAHPVTNIRIFNMTGPSISI